jgi:hypothetical protein
VQQALEAAQPYFAPLPGAPGLWRLLAPVEVRRAQASGARRPGARPNQAGIQAIVDRHLNQAPDLYRRSVDAETGAVTLGFYFPDIATQHYAETIALIAEEAGVSVAVSPQPHQGMLAEAALAALPDGLTASRAPSILLDQRIVRVRCEGQVSQAAIRASQERFLARTGWHIDLTLLAPLAISVADSATPRADPTDATASTPNLIEGRPGEEVEPLRYDLALWVAREQFGRETGCYRISADQQAAILTLRFEFPNVASMRYAARIAELAAGTGWRVQIHPQAHQGALGDAARHALPDGLSLVGALSFTSATREVLVRCRGTADADAIAAAQERFAELTGWRLVLRMS